MYKEDNLLKFLNLSSDISTCTLLLYDVSLEMSILASSDIYAENPDCNYIDIISGDMKQLVKYIINNPIIQDEYFNTISMYEEIKTKIFQDGEYNSYVSYTLNPIRVNGNISHVLYLISYKEILSSKVFEYLLTSVSFIEKILNDK